MALTELSDTPIRAAISLFARPSNTHESTCCSRSVNARVRLSCEFDLGSQGSLQLLLVQPHFASHHVTDCLCQQRRRVVFSKNSRNSRTDQLPCHACIHPCRHNENLSLESVFLCQSEKLPAIALAEIEIEKYYIDRLALQNLQTLSNCAAMGATSNPGSAARSRLALSRNKA